MQTHNRDALGSHKTERSGLGWALVLRLESVAIFIDSLMLLEFREQTFFC